MNGGDLSSFQTGGRGTNNRRTQNPEPSNRKSFPGPRPAHIPVDRRSGWAGPHELRPGPSDNQWARKVFFFLFCASPVAGSGLFLLSRIPRMSPFKANPGSGQKQFPEPTRVREVGLHSSASEPADESEAVWPLQESGFFRGAEKRQPGIHPPEEFGPAIGSFPAFRFIL
jgi:hypothetical protein